MAGIMRVLPVRRLIGLISIVFMVFHMYRVQQADVLDFDDLIHMDAEDLAKGGISDAFNRLKPLILEYSSSSLPDILDVYDAEVHSYHVVVAGERRSVYEAGFVADEPKAAWGRATAVLFDIVNQCLVGSSVKLYAINKGHELAGVFLTSDDVERVCSLMSDKRDWPYFPAKEAPWYGQAH